MKYPLKEVFAKGGLTHLIVEMKMVRRVAGGE
jgi:hypothetical protein